MAKLLSSLPVGTLVKDATSTYNGVSVVWKVMEHGHSGDPSGSTALVTERIVSLKCYDAIEASNADSERKSYGNNRWLYSNIRQWLNSDAAAGKWYTAQHSADAPPTNANTYRNCNEYYQEAGFLSNFSANMKTALLTSTKRVVKNTVTDGGSYEDTTQKIFLLSSTEARGTNENSIAEGTIYSLFNTNSNLKCMPTAEAVSKSEYTNSGLSATDNWGWWLRTPAHTSASSAKYITKDGSLLGGIVADVTNGVRPACCVSSSILVSDTADSDGVYTIQWNAAPTITTASTSLGDKNKAFDVTFSIKDPDGDTTTGKVKLDGTEVMSLNPVTQGQTYTYSVTGEILSSLAIGTHSVVIEATDSMGNASTKTISFNRVASAITISGSDDTLGSIWTVPEYRYTVADSVGNAVTVTEYVDDVQVRAIQNAQTAGTITFNIGETFNDLENEKSHTLKIKAVNTDGSEAYRQITFIKTPDRLEFETKPIETDAAAKRIAVSLNYDKTGSPDVKVEVCNDIMAAKQHWEDMTENFNAKKTYFFTNEPEDGFGVSVRVTISKNQNTSRVYCKGIGFCFD